MTTAARARTAASAAGASGSHGGPPPPAEPPLLHAIVIVLGDVGRSPRMQYHALSLLQEGHDVSLLGYDGEELIPPLQEFARGATRAQLQVVRFTPWSPPKWTRQSLWAKPLYYPWRLLGILGGLLHALFVRTTITTRRGSKTKKKALVLVQNPPSIPLLWVTHLYCSLWNVSWMIDWHNLGYTMFHDNDDASGEGPKKKKESWIRRFAKAHEGWMAPRAHGHFFVTRAMKDFVQDAFFDSRRSRKGSVPNAAVLYDCPPDFFRPTTIKEEHELMLKLQSELQDSRSVDDSKSTTTLFTQEISPGTIVLRPDRPALLVSSTSWTPDEDFSILFNALVLLKRRMRQSPPCRKIVVIVTGKGPLKAYYQDEIRKTFADDDDLISIRTLWLESADYPTLLGCADLGISLHTSTSGLDLPMKVVDMLGCQVPVCAYGYPCLSELLQDGVQGRVFGSSEELARQLYQLLLQEPHERERFRCQIRGRLERWHANWKRHALPVIQQVAVAEKDSSGRDGRILVVGILLAVVGALLGMLVWKLKFARVEELQ